VGGGEKEEEKKNIFLFIIPPPPRHKKIKTQRAHLVITTSCSSDVTIHRYKAAQSKMA